MEAGTKGSWPKALFPLVVVTLVRKNNDLKRRPDDVALW
jgi:hypothetical protein